MIRNDPLEAPRDVQRSKRLSAIVQQRYTDLFKNRVAKVYCGGLSM